MQSEKDISSVKGWKNGNYANSFTDRNGQIRQFKFTYISKMQYVI